MFTIATVNGCRDIVNIKYTLQNVYIVKSEVNDNKTVHDSCIELHTLYSGLQFIVQDLYGQFTSY